jgi:hypothetical protein
MPAEEACFLLLIKLVLIFRLGLKPIILSNLQIPDKTYQFQSILYTHEQPWDYLIYNFEAFLQYIVELIHGQMMVIRQLVKLHWTKTSFCSE